MVEYDDIKHGSEMESLAHEVRPQDRIISEQLSS